MELLVWIIVIAGYLLVQALFSGKKRPAGSPEQERRIPLPDPSPESRTVRTRKIEPRPEPGDPEQETRVEPGPGPDPAVAEPGRQRLARGRDIAPDEPRPVHQRRRVLSASASQLRRAIVLREILGPPRGLE